MITIRVRLATTYKSPSSQLATLCTSRRFFVFRLFTDVCQIFPTILRTNRPDTCHVLLLLCDVHKAAQCRQTAFTIHSLHLTCKVPLADLAAETRGHTRLPSQPFSLLYTSPYPFPHLSSPLYIPLPLFPHLLFHSPYPTRTHFP